MAPLRSLGNIFSAFDDFYARTGKDAVTPDPLSQPFSASGGSKFTLGGFTYHLFHTSGAFSVDGGTVTVDYFLLGGGGGGSCAGGGSGGCRSSFPNHPAPLRGSSVPLGPGPYAITIGAGGDGAAQSGGAAESLGTAGGHSNIAFPTAIRVEGGGHGSFLGDAGDGGSGGGAGYGVPRTGGSADTPPQPGQRGFGGGDGGDGPLYMGGGGGGLSQAGNPGEASPNPGQGGSGAAYPEIPGPGVYPLLPSPVQSAIGGTAWRDALGPTGLIGGGGGGGDNLSGSNGGAGGGGNGGGANTVGSNAVTNTGSGGGGGGNDSVMRASGDGSDGLCIIRYS